MAIGARLRSWWRGMRHRTALEQDLADEVEFHIAARASDLVARHGLPPHEARRVARLEFGAVERYKEEARGSAGLTLIDELRGDLRHAFRTFARNKTFTAAAVVTLALAIGANTAVFSLIDSVMVRQLPVERPEELVEVMLQRPGSEPDNGFTNALWEAVRDRQDVFSGVFVWSVPQPFVFGDGSVGRQVAGMAISGDYFPTLGVGATVGRLISTRDDYRGCPAIAMLGHDFWQTQFGGDAVVGRAITLHRQPFEIVGVVAPHFHGLEVGRTFDVAIPLCASAPFDRRNLDSTGRWWLNIMGRLAPGVTLAQAKARLQVLSPDVMRASGQDVKRQLVASASAAGPSGLRRRFGEPLQMLMAGVAIVLLIGCANLASLILARATTRAQEMAVRTALGASRRRLVRQLLTESLALAALGAALGVLVAELGTAFLLRSLRVFVDVSLDGRVLGFTAVIAVTTGLLVGLMPAIRLTSRSMLTAMKSRSAAGGNRPARARAGKWIVGAQVAMSLLLLIGGGLLLRTFLVLLALDPGFDRHNVIVATAKVPTFAADTVTQTAAQREAAFSAITARISAMPGVTSVARAFTTPLGSDNWSSTIDTDAASSPAGEGASASFNFVTSGYFATLRMPLVAGRDFDPRDTKQSAAVAIVNETAAREFFAGRDAVGRTFHRRGQDGPIGIVGIVKDAKYGALREPAPPTIFLPAAQAPARAEANEIIVRTSVPPAAVIPAIEDAARSVSAELALTARTLEEQVADDLVLEQLLAILAGFFGALAVLLSAIGLYGVLNYLVTDRRPEFGVRQALGADPSAILRLVMREIVGVVAAGIAVGLAVALASVPLLQSMLFGLEPHDAVTTIAAVGLLSSVCAVAAFVPARRAARTPPITALRAE